MSTAFDTLKLADRLESAGFTAQQARGTATALSDALSADLATKGDIAGVRAEIAGVRAEIADVRAEIGGVRAEIGGVKADLGGVKADLGASNAMLTARIVEVHSELKADIAVLKWMIGFVLALVLTVFVKLLVH